MRRVTSAGLALLTIGLLFSATTVWSSAAVEPADPRRAAAVETTDRPQDRAALVSVMQTFVKAFEQKNAKALAAHFTPEGEFENDDGKFVRGREALERAFTKFFAKAPALKATVRTDALRFLSNDAAIEEGTVSVCRGWAEGGDARYTVFFVRDQGKWVIARMAELAGEAHSVADLGWLIGEWKSATGQGADIRTSYSWDANKKFIQARFSIAEKALTLSGLQVIGVDPATGALRTWTYETDGGTAVSDWARDGDHWVLTVAGTLADGRKLTETNVLRRINNDTVTWQSVNRSLDGADLPDLPPVKATRVKSAG
jgi:uncharacterized protein (TIGR02246 family)